MLWLECNAREGGGKNIGPQGCVKDFAFCSSEIGNLEDFEHR